jgi:hypothetical protein
MLTREMTRELLPEDGMYKGSAKLDFQNPDGSVWGRASINLYTSHRPTVRIDVEGSSIPPQYHGMLMAFLRGESRKTSGGATRISIGGVGKVGSLEVATSQGTFRAARALIGGGTFLPFGTGAEWFEVVPYGLELVAGTAAEEIWCAPLLGDLAEFRRCANACFLKERRPYMQFAADGNDCGLVVFSPSTTSAAGREFSAALFGFIGDRKAGTPDEAAALVPWGLLAALSFAIGNDVQVPWVEIRSREGELARRIHVQLGGTQSESGFPAFSPFDSALPGSGVSGVTEFLRLLCALPEEKRRSITPTMLLVRRGTPGNTTVDESITSLIKALDATCKRNGLGRIPLAKNLDAPMAAEVDSVITDARRRLTEIRQRRKTEGRPDQLAILDRIISRQANVASDDLDFGITVGALLRKFGLNDASAMGAYYSSQPGSSTWEGLLSYIRGEVVHSGAIHVENRAEIVSWFELARHLHDICKRLLLKEVGYSGTYSASNVRFTGPYALDRVGASATAADLGYTAPPDAA